jgi:hypothetical protein
VVKKGISLDDLFGPGDVVQPQVQQKQFTQPIYPPVQNSWNQPQKSVSSNPFDEFEQMMGPPVKQQPVYQPPVQQVQYQPSIQQVQYQAPIQKQLNEKPIQKPPLNPWDEFDQMLQSNGKNSPMVSQQSVQKQVPLQNPIQQPPQAPKLHTAPPQAPIITIPKKPVVEHDPWAEFVPKQESKPVVQKPVVPKLVGVGGDVKKNNDFGFQMTSPKKSPKSEEIKQSIQVVGDGKAKGSHVDKTDAKLEQISKSESDNFAWEKSFFSGETKKIDNLRGEARKDPFESQFKDITPKNMNPFNSTTNWQK